MLKNLYTYIYPIVEIRSDEAKDSTMGVNLKYL